MLFISCLYFVVLLIATNSLEYHDICQSHGSKLYFRSEDSGTIEAKNIVNNSTNNTFQECKVELITCPSCVIVVNFTWVTFDVINLQYPKYINYRFINLSHRCENFKYPFSDCNCEYIEIMEEPYEKLSSKKICGTDIVGSLFNYRSQARNLIIKLVFIYDNNISFFATYKSLSEWEWKKHIYMCLSDYFSIDNRLILPDDSPPFFTSPYFPSYYVEDLIIEYLITCPEIISDNCQIELIFTDFQIAPMSIMEVGFAYNIFSMEHLLW